MKLDEENITLLTPIYNTSIDALQSHYQSIKQFPKIKKIYWNDGITCKETKSILYDKIAKLPNVSIFQNQENRGQEYTVHCLANANINTEYIIRVDADDSLVNLPEAPEEDFDILLIGKAAENLFNLLSKGGSLNGSVFKKEIYRIATADHDKIKKYSNWIHEDVWYALNIFIGQYKENSTYKILYEINRKKIVRRHFHDKQITNKKVTSRKLKRFDTFLVWSIFHNDFDIYYEVTATVFGYDSQMSMRRKRFKVK